MLLISEITILCEVSYIFITASYSTVKSRFNKWPPSADIDSLNWDFTLYRDFLLWNSILVTTFYSLNQDFTLNRDPLNRDFTVLLNWIKKVVFRPRGEFGFSSQGHIFCAKGSRFEVDHKKTLICRPPLMMTSSTPLKTTLRLLPQKRLFSKKRNIDVIETFLLSYKSSQRKNKNLSYFEDQCKKATFA